MPLLILGALLVSVIEITLKPRLDKTSEGHLLLWYNSHGKREYIKL